MYNHYYQQTITQQPVSYARILHAAPNAPAVDVYANGTQIASNLPYTGFTEYLAIVPGQYNIKVYPAGQTNTPVINTSITVPPNSIYTVAAIGQLPNIELYPILEPIMAIPQGKVLVRAAHLSPNAPAVDVTLPDGTPLFTDVKYKDVTNYLAVDPGTYTLQVRLAGTDTVVLTIPNIQLHPNRFHTVDVVGLAGGTPGLQALIPLDGNSYINL